MKIICIGRNYKKHAQELNNEVPEKPVFFLKPDSALLNNNKPFYIPEFSNEVHHEVELVVRINRLGKHIDKQFAHRYYNEVTLGIDFTARDIQRQCQADGMPWEIAKAFDGSAPIGEFIKLDKLPDIQNLSFRLEKNGKTAQDGNTKNMIFSVDEIITYVSQFITLKIGDLIFTGTPAGVSPVAINDKLIAYLEGDKVLGVDVK